MLDFDLMLKNFISIVSYLPVTIKLTVGALLIAFPVSFFFAFTQITKKSQMQIRIQSKPKMLKKTYLNQLRLKNSTRKEKKIM